MKYTNKFWGYSIAAGLFACFLIVSSAGPAAAAPDRQRGVTLGTPAPDFTLKDRFGNTVSLRDFAGKKVILFFWVSWCICRDQLPLLQQYRDAHKDGGYEVVAVSIDAQGRRYVTPISDLAGVKFPMLLDPGASTARSYHYPATPATFLIDEAGIVRKQFLPEFDLANGETRAALDEFLALPPAKSDAAATKAAGLDDMKKAVEANPQDAAALRSLAGLLLSIGDTAGALPHLEKLVEIDKRACEDKFSLASAHYALGNNEQALKYWKAASKCDPTNYIYMRTAQSFENPDMFYTKDKMKGLYIGELKK